MEHKPINLKTLSMDELAGVVNLYPWYGAARKELCRRMAGLGGESWGLDQYADQALYIEDRGIVADIMRMGESQDYSDKDLETLVRSYIDGKKSVDEDNIAPVRNPTVRVPGGDFFSRTEYDKVRRDEDNIFSGFKAAVSVTDRNHDDSDDIDFCTETLAHIYAEQGYYEQAKRIYGKLILAFPEKSAYFASLIGKLDNLINNQTL